MQQGQLFAQIYVAVKLERIIGWCILWQWALLSREIHWRLKYGIKYANKKRERCLR